MINRLFVCCNKGLFSDFAFNNDFPECSQALKQKYKKTFIPGGPATRRTLESVIPHPENFPASAGVLLISECNIQSCKNPGIQLIQRDPL